MIKTTQVASDRDFDDTKTVIPAEYARGVYIEHPPSAQALKLMHLLISKAGGRIADDVQHEIRLADIKAIEGMRNHSRDTLRALFIELSSSVMHFDDREALCEIIGNFMDEIKLDYSQEVSSDLVVKWYFGRTFRTMAEQSNHWAIIDRQTVFALSSRYSILLFQYFASLQGLKYKTGEVFTVPQIRSLLGIPDGKIKRFADLKKDILTPAIAEINQLSRFSLTAIPRKTGRTVTTIEITWESKPDLTKEKRELQSSKIGRKARRNGTEDKPIIIFPETGVISYDEPFVTIARKYGNGKDINLIAQDFRRWAQGKFELNDIKIVERFTAFCKKAKV